MTLNADGVLLSACNTAAGRRARRAGSLGAGAGVLLRGGRNLLVSHWPVASQALVRLTTLAIRAISADPTLAPAEALRRGMLALMDDPASDSAHPRDWAPFVMVGAGAAAPGRSAGATPR